jgi:hypothetical protein
MSEITLPDGTVFKLGNLVPDKQPLSFTEYPEADILSFEDCMELANDPNQTPASELFPFVLNQGGRSSCNAYAVGAALMKKRILEGRKHIELGPESLYALINGGRDAGSMLDDGMRAVVSDGIAPREMVPFEAFRKSEISMEAFRKGREFRAHECYQIKSNSFDKFWRACCSAVARRDMLVCAVMVGQNYMKLDRHGCAGVDRGLGNHAVHAHGLLTAHNPKSFADLFLDQVGSWGKRVHSNGAAGFRTAHLEGTFKIHATYAIRSTTVDSASSSPTMR